MAVTTDRRGDEVYYRAIHRQVLVVYVANPHGWAAYVVPVEGIDHRAEARAWFLNGTKLKEEEAESLYPSVVENFRDRGLEFRK